MFGEYLPFYVYPYYSRPKNTYTRKIEKYNRNSPCVCGSGKKYKKCCIDKIPENFIIKK